jgi:uncharacterized protein with ParB-like and HNH nuclease domain
MSNFHKPETDSIFKLIEKIDNSQILIPEFQREFVWELEQTIDLFDSISRDIFIGSIIFGTPQTEFAYRKIDDRPRKQKGKKRPKVRIELLTSKMIEDAKNLGKTYQLILDGQQRVTSIYRTFKPEINDDIWFVLDEDKYDIESLYKKIANNEIGKDLNEFNIYYDSKEPQDKFSIKISDLFRIEVNNLDDDNK